jgi:hypothetical protein
VARLTGGSKARRRWDGGGKSSGHDGRGSRGAARRSCAGGSPEEEGRARRRRELRRPRVREASDSAKKRRLGHGRRLDEEERIGNEEIYEGLDPLGKR